ncbi:Uncharacterised protein [Segatella copri]|nr:Uncharacterised protein [Segatella copri]
MVKPPGFSSSKEHEAKDIAPAARAAENNIFLKFIFFIFLNCLECDIYTKNKLLVSWESIRATHFRICTFQLTVHSKNPRIIGSKIETALLHKCMLRDALWKCITQCDVLYLDERTIIYIDGCIANRLVITTTRAWIISTLVFFCPIVYT